MPIHTQKTVNIIRIDNVTLHEKIKRRMLPACISEYVTRFALCQIDCRGIFLSGGRSTEPYLSKCQLLNVLREEWNEVILPPLNIARQAHSSISFEHKVYVVCGSRGYNDLVHSIEVLGLRMREDSSVSFVSKAWSIFEPKNFVLRTNPLLAPLSGSRLLVYGGIKNFT